MSLCLCHSVIQSFSRSCEKQSVSSFQHKNNTKRRTFLAFPFSEKMSFCLFFSEINHPFFLFSFLSSLSIHKPCTLNHCGFQTPQMGISWRCYLYGLKRFEWLLTRTDHKREISWSNSQLWARSQQKSQLLENKNGMAFRGRVLPYAVQRRDSWQIPCSKCLKARHPLLQRTLVRHLLPRPLHKGGLGTRRAGRRQRKTKESKMAG